MLGITNEEMNKLNELSARYASSGNNRDALTHDEWAFVNAIGLKLIEAHKSLPDES